MFCVSEARDTQTVVQWPRVKYFSAARWRSEGVVALRLHAPSSAIRLKHNSESQNVVFWTSERSNEFEALMPPTY